MEIALTKAWAVAVLLAVLACGCLQGTNPSAFSYSADDLREQHDPSALAPDKGRYDYRYDWNNSDTNHTYLAVSIDIQEETEFHVVNDKVGAFRNWRVLWGLDQSVENVTQHGITRAYGAGALTQTTCSDETRRLSHCPQRSEILDATSHEAGTLDPGVVTFITSIYGSEASSLWIRAWFDKPVDPIATVEGETALQAIQGDLADGKVSFEGAFTAKTEVLVQAETYRASYEGPVTISTPSEQREFHRDRFGWSDQENHYFEFRPHVFGGPGEYRVSLGAEEADGERPPLLLVGQLYNAHFLLDHDD